MMKQESQKIEMEGVWTKIVGMIDEGFQGLEREFEEELENFYWDHYENSDIILIGQDQQSAKQSFSLSYYERANPSFLSSHSVASQHQVQSKQKPQKRSKSINTRPKTILTNPKLYNRRIKTQQTQEEQPQPK